MSGISPIDTLSMPFRRAMAPCSSPPIVRASYVKSAHFLCIERRYYADDALIAAG